uniref:Secretion-regulating guanine nucleotide exchange factor-like n=1 Tax=Hirondellea gigas TaxID=1518452 RepID=A0A2P2I0C3_9CRUS
MLGLYSWGANSHGQLGLGYSCEMVTEPHRVDELPAQLCESAISCIVGGGGHTLLLTNTGTLYGAGWNNCGQIGDGTASRCVPCFRECRALEGQVMVGVACGWAHSVACSVSGQVWVWGSNSHGQLGLPPDEVPFSSLPICLQLKNVVSVAAGLRHTVVATRDGVVYSWGHGHRGQLGHLSDDGSTLKILATPKLIEALQTKVVEVSCGQNMTYAVTSDGMLLAWGDNKWGQLAHDPRNLLFFTCPLQIPCNYFGCSRVSWVRAGWTHCVVGTTSGDLYVWGRADYGQLGSLSPDGEPECLLGSDTDQQDEQEHTKQDVKYRYIPSLLRAASGLRVEQLVCGSEHTLALLSKASASSVYISSEQRRHSLPKRSTQKPAALMSQRNTLPRLEPSNNIVASFADADSGTVSSSSDSAQQLPGSCSPTSDTEEKHLEIDEVLPSLGNLKINEFDQPCTLSPIDSPRTLVQTATTTPISEKVILNELDTLQNEDSEQLKECSIEQSSKKTSNVLHDSLSSCGAAEAGSQQSITDKWGTDYSCMYSWGWNEHGNCGLGNTNNVALPRRIPVDGKILLIAAGSGHSFALIKNYNKIAL